MSVVERETAAQKVVTARSTVAELEAEVDRAFDIGDSVAMVTAYRKLREARASLRAAEVELARLP